MFKNRKDKIPIPPGFHGWAYYRPRRMHAEEGIYAISSFKSRVISWDSKLSQFSYYEVPIRFCPATITSNLINNRPLFSRH